MAATECSFAALKATEPDAGMWAHADMPPELLRGGAAAMPGLAQAIAALRREGLFDAFDTSDDEESSDEESSDEESPDEEKGCNQDRVLGGDGDDGDSDDSDDSDDDGDDSDDDDSDGSDTDSDIDSDTDSDDGRGAAQPETIEITTVRASPAMLPMIDRLTAVSKESLAHEAQTSNALSDDDASLASENYVTQESPAHSGDDDHATAALARVNANGDLLAIDARALFRLLSQRQPVAPLRSSSH